MLFYLITGSPKLTESNSPIDPISRSKLPIFFCLGAVTEGDKKVTFEAGAQGAILEGPLTRTRSPLPYAPP